MSTSFEERRAYLAHGLQYQANEDEQPADGLLKKATDGNLPYAPARLRPEFVNGAT
jgi:hypothetical protein